MPHRNVRGPASHDPVTWAGSESEPMRAVLDRARSVAPTRATVLLTGETGVGKSVLAKLIHAWSDRAYGPFVSVHCGALPDSLLESELFGHEKGAFTGADRRRAGKFELAHGGTLFLDEIGTITPAMQVKLLDVLQERRFHRVGGEQSVEVDVRIVAASNDDLEERQRDGSFRADLYHRLHVFPIDIPPLRERMEDLPQLVKHLLGRLNAVYGKEVSGLDPVVERAFRQYAWPGNVRELENVLERAHILESSTRITAQHVPFEILGAPDEGVPVAVPVDASRTLAEARDEAVAAAERHYLIELLALNQGRIDVSARVAGVSTRQLRKLLSKHAIDKAEFKARRGARRRAEDVSELDSDG